MNLKDNFQNFCSEKKISESKYRFNRFVFENSNAIGVGLKVATSLVEFATTKTSFALVKGGFEILRSLTDSYYPDVFFAEANGWRQVKLEGIPLRFFNPALSSHKFTPVQFGNKNYTLYHGKIYHTEIGDIGFADVKDGEEEYESGKMFFRHLDITQEQVFDFLMVELLKKINTKFVSLDIKEKKMTLVSEENYSIPSERSKTFANYIRTCVDFGINRSLLFYGPPGTGKTTLAQAIIKDLDFKTLKFRYNKDFDFTTFKFLLDKIKPDAIIIDDFDQTDTPENLLEFLEVARKRTKLVIGVVNSLKRFHPAILRPGRFDEIIKIDSLELDTVRVVLGDLYPTYGAKVQSWPIAYINEFVIRSKLVPKKDLLKNYKELQVRVDNQLKDISEIAEPGEKVKKK